MLLFLTSGSDSISGSDFYLCQSIKRRDYLGGSRTPHCSATPSGIPTTICQLCITTTKVITTLATFKCHFISKNTGSAGTTSPRAANNLQFLEIKIRDSGEMILSLRLGAVRID